MVRAGLLTSIAIFSLGAEAVSQTPASRPQPPPESPPGEWHSQGRDDAQTRFSPLAQITAANVGGLRPVWSFSTGVVGAHEGAPLVIGAVMYVHSSFPNAVYALDLTKPGAPIIWTWKVPAAVARLALPTGCCGTGSRGLGYHPSGKILVPLLHGELVALDAATGRELWKVKNAEGLTGATMPGAPTVVKDLVIVGTGGAEYGTRGSVAAYDVETGKLVWRAFHTGPDSDVLIEGEANSSYPSHRQPDLGMSTWPAGEWSRGGATATGAISFDPELDLIYYGTDHPGAYNASVRAGDNKWSATIFARAASTGKVRWAYQLTPHDQWGYDASNENILVDLTVQGAPVKALVHFDRNGFAYTIDRASGKLVLAERYGPANWASRIDIPSGRPIIDPTFAQGTGKKTGICPAIVGTKGLQPAAFSRVTSLFFVPTANLCMELTPTKPTFAPGKPYTGATIRMTAGPGPNRGRFVAWDAAAGTIAWQVQENYPVTGGALATAGGLVFYGTMDGWLKAVDHRSGLELWRFKTPSGIVGSPMTFSGPDGKQYVAVLSGLGGWIGTGASGAFPDIETISTPGGVLTVFGL